MHNKTIKLATAGLLALAPLTGITRAQTADALIDKLVDKGILTVKEANQLREESDKGFTQAFQVKTGMPDWVTNFRLNGDFRGRFEQNNAESDEYFARNRYRMRLRVGAVAVLGDQFDVGFRLATGNPQTNPGGTLVGGAPITANQDLNSLESRKFIWVDAAYAKWTPAPIGNFSFVATIGKMDNPFQLSNMIWDYDINPEGGALQSVFKFNDNHTLKGNAAFFVLDELNQSAAGATIAPPAGPIVAKTGPSHDPFVYGAQLVFESKWTPKIDSSLGAAVFDIAHKDSLSSVSQPFYNSGTTRDPATGAVKYNMNPIIGTGALTYTLDSIPMYPDKFPIKLSGEYIYNPGAPTANTGYRLGLTLGKAGKKKAWEVSYRYQRLEADAWFDALVDDDNGAFYNKGNPTLAGTGKTSGWFGGTNVKGHLVQASYSFTDFMNFTFTYYLNDLVANGTGKSSDAGHFMADLMWKF